MRPEPVYCHLDAGCQGGKTAQSRVGHTAPLLQHLERSPRDHVSYLLSIGAEIEHCRMVQYLYGAYSLGGPQVPPGWREAVRGWQRIVLGIAKQKMGNLMSVQGVLRLIGASAHLEREDFPWNTPFYPFPFQLEPLTLSSLAKYVYAEAPVDWDGGALGAEIRARVVAQKSSPQHLAELFNALIALVQDPDYLPDSVFQAHTWRAQANWTDWGRGYRIGQRGDGLQAGLKATPDVLVVQVSSRDDAVNALKAVAAQREATSGEQFSHFVRFLAVYVEMREALEAKTCDESLWLQARPAEFSVGGWEKAYPTKHLSQRPHDSDWQPARKVAVNPYVSRCDAAVPDQASAPVTRISHPETALWATLQNTRYQMLLTWLIHGVTLDGGVNAAGLTAPRGTSVDATFGEMDNLQILAEILTNSPVSSQPDSGLAGPPFQMPYNLNSSSGEANLWRRQQDLLQESSRLVTELLGVCALEHQPYLQALGETDDQLIALNHRILADMADPPRRWF